MNRRRTIEIGTLFYSFKVTIQAFVAQQKPLVLFALNIMEYLIHCFYLLLTQGHPGGLCNSSISLSLYPFKAHLVLITGVGTLFDLYHLRFLKEFKTVPTGG